MILAGDIGGTSARLACFKLERGRLRTDKVERFTSRDHRGLGDIVRAFIGAQEREISNAAFGIPGPVRSGEVLCASALDLFVSLYAAEAGNFALKILAAGGVYLGGGIAPKILEKLRAPEFMRSFSDKGRMRDLLETIPVSVILNEDTALLGAARFAALRAGLPDPGARRARA